MSGTAAAKRQLQALAEASQLPLREEWLDDLATRWDLFREGIERLSLLDPDFPTTFDLDDDQ